MKKYLLAIIFLSLSDLLYSQSFVNVVVDHIKYELFTQYQGDYSPMDVGPATVIYNDEEIYSGDFVIPDSITYSFVWYNRLAGKNQTISKTIPVTSIRSLAFANCIDLNSVYIPKTISYIDKDLFPGCDNLSSIIINSENNKYDSRGNCNAIIETSSNTLISGCKNSVVPSGVTTIGVSSFHGCRNLTSFIIPCHVNSIDDNAFEDCTGLRSIEVLSHPNSIGISVFKGCSNLKKVIFDCEIVAGLFNDLSSIEQIVLKDGVRTIDGWAFHGCTAVTSITIPNSVTSIGSCAFYGSNALTSVILSQNVSFLGEGAFCCTNLSDIYCYAEQIPDGFAAAFNYYNTNDDAIKQMTLHVPVVAIESYKQLNVDFKDIVPIEGNVTGLMEQCDIPTILVRNNGGMVFISGIGDGADVIIYNISGQLIGQGKASSNRVEIETTLSVGNICIIKIGGRLVKYILK